MILDKVERLARYAALHPGLAAACEFLARGDIARLEPGRHAIDGERLFAIIGRETGRGRSGARLEAHRRYIDVQLALDGLEEIGWRALADCTQVAEPYSDERDIIFFGDRPTAWLALPVGTMAIYFPDDAHAPLAGDGPVHKVVVKIAVAW